MLGRGDIDGIGRIDPLLARIGGSGGKSDGSKENGTADRQHQQYLRNRSTNRGENPTIKKCSFRSALA
jgi:hypothetical protein